MADIGAAITAAMRDQKRRDEQRHDYAFRRWFLAIVEYAGIDAAIKAGLSLVAAQRGRR